MLTDYEALAQIRSVWAEFLVEASEPPEMPGAGRVIHTSRSSTPGCEAVALHDGLLSVVAHGEHDESLIAQDFQRVSQAQLDARFGEGVVRGLRVLSAREGTALLAEELALLGLQVQRLLKQLRQP